MYFDDYQAGFHLFWLAFARPRLNQLKSRAEPRESGVMRIGEKIDFPATARKLRAMIKYAKNTAGVTWDIKNCLRGAVPPPDLIVIEATRKLGENVLALPLVSALTASFPGSRVKLHDPDGNFPVPACVEKGGTGFDSEFNLRVRISFGGNCYFLKLGDDIVEITDLKDQYNGSSAYQREVAFPWWLWDRPTPDYSFPRMVFPEALARVSSAFSGQLSGPGKKIAFFIGSSDFYDQHHEDFSRIWGAEKFARLAQLFCAEPPLDTKLFLLTGRSAAEKKALDRVVRPLDFAPFFSRITPVAEATTTELYHLFQLMDLVISADTGPAHLAYASGAKTMVLVNKSIWQDGWYPPQNLVPNLELFISPGLEDVDQIEPEDVACRAEHLGRI